MRTVALENRTGNARAERVGYRVNLATTWPEGRPAWEIGRARRFFARRPPLGLTLNPGHSSLGWSQPSPGKPDGARGTDVPYPGSEGPPREWPWHCWENENWCLFAGQRGGAGLIVVTHN